eukprot:156464-Pyramimonas_sp.AAC.1
MSTGVSSHWGLAVVVKAVAPLASVATPYSPTLIARCPDGVLTRSITLAPLPRRRLDKSALGMTTSSFPFSRTRMARTLAMLSNPKIAGKFSPDPSATLAESASSFSMAGFPARFPLHAQAILKCPDVLHTAAPATTQVTYNGLLRFHMLVSWLC